MHDPVTRLEVTTLSARVQAALGKPADAIKSLRSVVAEPHRRGTVADELNARLPLGEIEIKSGQGRLGRSHLQELQKDAQSCGFLFMARKAAAVLGSPIN